MSQFQMYRCDVCGVTGDKPDAFQAVSFPAPNAYHVPTWHVCADTTACYLELWKRRAEVSEYGKLVGSISTGWFDRLFPPGAAK